MGAALPSSLSIGFRNEDALCLGTQGEAWADIQISREQALPLGKTFDTKRFGKVKLTPGSFSSVVCRDFLERADNLLASVTSLKNLLGPGGILAVRMPHPLNPDTWNEGSYRNVMGLSSGDIFAQAPDLLGWGDETLVFDGAEVQFTDFGYQLHVNHQISIDKLLYEPRALLSLDMRFVKRKAPVQHLMLKPAAPDVTVIFATYKRPSLSVRQIDALLNQTHANFELLLYGDCCPDFAKLINDPLFKAKVEFARSRGTQVVIQNMPENHGTPHAIINDGIARAQGKYLMFAADDDFVAPNHIESYLTGINGTDFALVIFDSVLVGDYYTTTRQARLEINNLGHSEIIVSTAAARKAPPHIAGAAHDWDFIAAVAAMGECGKSTNPPTYYVNMTSRLKHFNVAS